MNADPETTATHPRHGERYSIEARGRFISGRQSRFVAMVGEPPSITSFQTDLLVSCSPRAELELLAILRALVAATVPLFAIEWLQQRVNNDFFLMAAPRWVTYPALSCLCFFCLVMLRQYQASFIYFQF